MIPLADVRQALKAALVAGGFNYSDTGDTIPMGALVDPFLCQYHENIGGVTDLVLASTVVKVTTDRADEVGAYKRLDDVMSSVPELIEAADGPWHIIYVVSATVANPITVGDATYASAEFVVQCYV